MTSQAPGLGQWAIIDLETTGLDASQDHIIDVGFLQFEDCRLVRQYRSLVHTDKPLGHFVQNLTGITPAALEQAPPWEEVRTQLMTLQNHHLIAHNAPFEEQFLRPHFDVLDGHSAAPQYWDSLPLLALLFPWRAQLKLEHFVRDWGLRDKEAHRAFEDALDLLKVLIKANQLLRERYRGEAWSVLNALFRHYRQEDTWYVRFLNLSGQQLASLAEQIGLDLKQDAEANNDGATDSHDKLLGEQLPLNFSRENIQTLMRSEERVRERIPHYRHRKSQEDLALRVGQSFQHSTHALIQAPTGTGKTLGYLLPASLFARERQAQVLIATGTKTLQQQVMIQDVPHLRQWTGLDAQQLKIKRLVGSSNHLCELLFRQDEASRDAPLIKHGFDQVFNQLFFEMAFYTNGKRESPPILRDGLPATLKYRFSDFRRLERELAVDYRACTGNQCPHRHQCSYLQDLREAKGADVVVGNHALMFHWPRSLPRPSYIVVDEAHRIEGEATAAFSLRASGEDLESLARALGPGPGALYYLLCQGEGAAEAVETEINSLRTRVQQAQQSLQEHLSVLPTLMQDYFHKAPRYTAEFWNELPVPQEGSDSNALMVRLESLHTVLDNLHQQFAPYAERFELEGGPRGSMASGDDDSAAATTRFQTFFSTVEGLAQLMEGICCGKEGFVGGLKYHQAQGYQLELAPIDIGRLLHSELLDNSASVAYISATLASGESGGNTQGMEWVTGYAHLAAERRFQRGLFLPSEYDYGERTRIYLCQDVPPLHDSTFVESVLRPIIPLIERLGGRTLLLFGARSRFDRACEFLWRELPPSIPLFVQGTGVGLVEDFKKHRGRGVLVGMESFGEGIDIPGEALQLVFIDKIPDMPMNLVTRERRRFYQDHFGNEFNDYYLSHRTRRLHQKLGRLMRQESDRGGVIIADGRVARWKPHTRQTLVQFMRPYHLRQAPLNQAIRDMGDFILTGANPSNPPESRAQVHHHPFPGKNFPNPPPIS